jgi:hypothetical protein
MPLTMPLRATWCVMSHGQAARPGSQSQEGVVVMWTAIWTVLGFVLLLCLLLFLGDAILAFVAERSANAAPTAYKSNASAPSKPYSRTRETP